MDPFSSKSDAATAPTTHDHLQARRALSRRTNFTLKNHSIVTLLTHKAVTLLCDYVQYRIVSYHKNNVRTFKLYPRVLFSMFEKVDKGIQVREV